MVALKKKKEERLPRTFVLVFILFLFFWSVNYFVWDFSSGLFNSALFGCDYKRLDTVDYVYGYPVPLKSVDNIESVYARIQHNNLYQLDVRYDKNNKINYMMVTGSFKMSPYNNVVYNVLFARDIYNQGKFDELVVDFDSDYTSSSLTEYGEQIPCVVPEFRLRWAADAFIKGMKLPENVEKELLNNYRIANFRNKGFVIF